MFRHLVLLVCFVATGAGCDLFPETPPDAQLPSGGSGGAGGTGGTGGVGGIGGTAGEGGTAGVGGTAGQGGTAGTGGTGGVGGTGGAGGVGGTAGNAGTGGTGAGGIAGSGGSGGGPAGGGGAGGIAGSAGAGGTLVSATIMNGDDDVNEDSNGYWGTATTVWSGTADDTVHSFTGLRFRGVEVPAGAEILDAWIEMYATTGQSQSIDVSMTAELDANCKIFNAGQSPSKRTVTASSDFVSTAPWQAGTYNRVGSVKAPLAEVFGLSGWASGNAVCVIIKGNGPVFSRRYAVSYEGSETEAPKLVVRYSIP